MAATVFRRTDAPSLTLSDRRPGLRAALLSSLALAATGVGGAPPAGAHERQQSGSPERGSESGRPAHLVAPGPLPGGGYVSAGAANSPKLVAFIQRRIARSGLRIRVDGVFGRETEAAVRRFQTARRLLVDGIVGRQTMGALKDSVEDDAKSAEGVRGGESRLESQGTRSPAEATDVQRYAPTRLGRRVLRFRVDPGLRSRRLRSAYLASGRQRKRVSLRRVRDGAERGALDVQVPRSWRRPADRWRRAIRSKARLVVVTQATTGPRAPDRAAGSSPASARPNQAPRPETFPAPAPIPDPPPVPRPTPDRTPPADTAPAPTPDPTPPAEDTAPAPTPHPTPPADTAPAPDPPAAPSPESEETAPSSSAPTAFVDRDSRGGRCDDARSFSAAGISTPWCSLERAVAAAPSGSRVYVRGGSYPKLTVKGGMRTDYTTLGAYGSEAVSIAGLYTESTAWLRFDRLKFARQVNLYTNSSQIQLLGGEISEPTTEGIAATHAVNIRAGSSDILLEGNKISTVAGTAVNLSSSSTLPPIARVTLRANHIQRAGTDGIQAKNFRDLTIEDNEFQGVRRYDPQQHPDVLQTVWGGTNLVFRRNFVHDNGAGILLKDGRVTDATLENNLIVNNSGDGMGFAIQIYDTTRPRLVNNTVWDNTYTVMLRAATTDAVVLNNILQGFKTDPTVTFAYRNHNLVPTGGGGTQDILKAPTFLDPQRLKYELAAASAGIDAARSDDAPTTDMRGRARTDDPAIPNTGSGARGYYDMGALERIP